MQVFDPPHLMGIFYQLLIKIVDDMALDFRTYLWSRHKILIDFYAEIIEFLIGSSHQRKLFFEWNKFRIFIIDTCA